jgi:hypothetical protein
MKSLRFGQTLSALLVLNFAFVFVPTAQAVNSLNTQTFNPSVSDHFVFLEDGFNTDWPKTAKYYFGANWNYLDNALTLSNPTTGGNVGAIISSINTFDFM